MTTTTPLIIVNIKYSNIKIMCISVNNLSRCSRHQKYISLFNLFTGSRHQIYFIYLTCSGVLDTRYIFLCLTCSVVLDTISTFMYLTCSGVLNTRCTFMSLTNRIGGVMVSVLASSAVDWGSMYRCLLSFCLIDINRHFQQLFSYF